MSALFTRALAGARTDAQCAWVGADLAAVAERQPGRSAVVVQFGRVGCLGASQSFGLRRQVSWLKVWRGGGCNFSATERAFSSPRDPTLPNFTSRTETDLLLPRRFGTDFTRHIES